MGFLSASHYRKGSLGQKLFDYQIIYMILQRNLCCQQILHNAYIYMYHACCGELLKIAQNSPENSTNGNYLISRKCTWIRPRFLTANRQWRWCKLCIAKEERSRRHLCTSDSVEQNPFLPTMVHGRRPISLALVLIGAGTPSAQCRPWLTRSQVCLFGLGSKDLSSLG